MSTFCSPSRPIKDVVAGGMATVGALTLIAGKGRRHLCERGIGVLWHCAIGEVSVNDLTPIRFD
ncbi:MAG: hypothetical protein R2867_03685 [Caldilineaceae bacterium]